MLQEDTEEVRKKRRELHPVGCGRIVKSGSNRACILVRTTRELISADWDILFARSYGQAFPMRSIIQVKPNDEVYYKHSRGVESERGTLVRSCWTSTLVGVWWRCRELGLSQADHHQTH